MPLLPASVVGTICVAEPGAVEDVLAPKTGLELAVGPPKPVPDVPFPKTGVPASLDLNAGVDPNVGTLIIPDPKTGAAEAPEPSTSAEVCPVVAAAPKLNGLGPCAED